MAANPIFPLYYNDIDRSTRDWTDEEFGCFVRLLMHQWDKGEIPKDTQRLARIVTSLASSWVTVGKKFTETESGMYNHRLEEIRQERLSFSKKQKKNGEKGGRKPKINPNYNPTINPTTNPNESLHYEYEYEDINKEKGGMGGKEAFSWDQVKTSFKNDFRWREKFCRDKNLSPPDLDLIASEFISDIELREDYKDLKDLKSHFTNWFNKKFNGKYQPGAATNGQPLTGGQIIERRLAAKLAARGKADPPG